MKRRKRLLAQQRIGERFGRWTIVGIGERAGTHRDFKCRCDCGTVKLINDGNLFQGRSTQCWRCGSATAAVTVGRKVAKLRGIPYVPIRERRCMDCGKPHCGNLNVKRCIACADIRRIGRPMGWSKGPRTLVSVGKEFGVKRQAVFEMVQRRGWDGMLAYYEAKGNDDAE